MTSHMRIEWAKHRTNRKKRVTTKLIITSIKRTKTFIISLSVEQMLLPIQKRSEPIRTENETNPTDSFHGKFELECGQLNRILKIEI